MHIIIFKKKIHLFTDEQRVMMKNSTGLIVWLFIIGFAVARQNYLSDDGNDKYKTKIIKFLFYFIVFFSDWKSNCEICKLFSIWNKAHNELNYEYPLPLQEHLMTRKSHRSPSLRLRFGRRDSPKPKVNFIMLY